MRTHMYDMGDMRLAAPALGDVQRQSRGKRFSTVPVALRRKLEEARSREVLLAVERADPLAGAVENRQSARQADCLSARQSLLRQSAQAIVPEDLRRSSSWLLVDPIQRLRFTSKVRLQGS